MDVGPDVQIAAPHPLGGVLEHADRAEDQPGQDVVERQGGRGDGEEGGGDEEPAVEQPLPRADLRRDLDADQPEQLRRVWVRRARRPGDGVEGGAAAGGVAGAAVANRPGRHRQPDARPRAAAVAGGEVGRLGAEQPVGPVAEVGQGGGFKWGGVALHADEAGSAYDRAVVRLSPAAGNSAALGVGGEGPLGQDLGGGVVLLGGELLDPLPRHRQRRDDDDAGGGAEQELALGGQRELGASQPLEHPGRPHTSGGTRAGLGRECRRIWALSGDDLTRIVQAATNRPSEPEPADLRMPAANAESSPAANSDRAKPEADGSRGKVLIVEDNQIERQGLQKLLRRVGFEVYAAEDPDKALGYVDEGVEVVLSDLHMGDLSGIDLLGLWKKRRADTQFILITGQSSVSSAVEAIKAGAYDYITKPIDPDDLEIHLDRAITARRKDTELQDLRRRLDHKFGVEKIIGESQQMRKVFAMVQRAAPVDSTVLVLGESGTGKELIAQALHHNSPRKKGPFVAVNVAAVPSTLVESELFGHVRGAFTGATDKRMGRFEQASGGTLFVDEIGDFELGLQAKLLRVLETLTLTPVGGHEDKKVDVRVVAATSRNLRKMVAEGTFREDLFYRLNVVSITLPPLRDRPDDVPLLVDHFIRDINASRGTNIKKVTPEVMRSFQSFGWPGNVRELRNILERMMVLADGEHLNEHDLPGDLHEGGESPGQTIPSGLTMEDLERLAIENSLSRFEGNRTHAADALGISVRTLQRKLAHYEQFGRPVEDGRR